jgi:flagellar hook-associated protein 2
MVTSLTSGVQASINMDPDTTFLDVTRTIDGRDLEMSFEGIAIQRSVNGVSDLIDGVSLKGISAAPGVAVSLEVRPDKEKASDRVRSFVQQYNGIQAFGREQLSTRIGESGALSGDSSMRQVTRALQSVMQEGNLFNFGITTDPKTGQLQLDESKLKMALANNYDQVVGLFVSDGGNSGLAEKMQSVIKGLQSKSSGALGQRIQGLEQRIRKQDDDIARKEQQLQDKTQQLKKKMSLINSKMGAINAEDAQLAQRLTP